MVRNTLYKSNDLCVDELFKGIIEDDEKKYNNLPIEKFKKLNKELFNAFLHVRMFKVDYIPKGEKNLLPTNKGKVEGAKAGIFNNLIRSAFKVCYITPIMPRPKIDGDGFLVVEDLEEDEDIIEGGEDANGEEGDLNDGDPLRLIVECPPQPIATVTPPRGLPSKHPPSIFLSSEPYLQLANQSIHGVIQKETNIRYKRIHRRFW